VNELERPIMQVLDAYKAAVFAKNVDAFVALYDQDVCVFDMWSKWSYNGIEAWRKLVTDWFGSLGTERVSVDVSDVRVVAAQDVAVVYAFVTYRGLSAEGEALRAMSNRLTLALKQRSGTWRIVHEHTSAPVDFETSKVIVQR